METYLDAHLWESFENDMDVDGAYTDMERSAWLDYLRLSKMTDAELLEEATELDKMIETEELHEDVKAILRIVSQRYWDVYSLRLAKDLSNLSVK
jgi:hypothetical protein